MYIINISLDEYIGLHRERLEQSDPQLLILLDEAKEILEDQQQEIEELLGTTMSDKYLEDLLDHKEDVLEQIDKWVQSLNDLTEVQLDAYNYIRNAVYCG